MQDHHKTFDRVLVDKEEEISRLKNHSQRLIALIKELKNEKKLQ
jgi:hypothetical protein